MKYLLLVLLSLFQIGSDYNIEGNPPQNPIVVEFEGKSEYYHQSISVTFNPVNQSLYLLENRTGRLLEVKPDGVISTLDTLSFEFSDESHFIETKYTGDGIMIWERGLGEVYEYNLKQSSLLHISDTNVDKLMFNHGGILDKKNELLVWGGYGFWETRKILLRFHSIKEEWVLESGDYDKHPNSSSFQEIRYDSSSNNLDYLSYLEDSWTNVRFYNTGYYDLDKKTWSRENWFHIDDDDFKYIKTVLHKTTYGIDPTNNIGYLSKRYFLDLNENTVLTIGNSFYPTVTVVGGFYSKSEKEWILFGKDVERSTPNLTFLRLPNQEINFTEVPTISYSSFILKKYWWLWLMVIGVGGLLFKYFRQPKKHETDQSKVRIHFTENDLQVFQNGSQLPITDDYIERVWRLIYTLKQHGQKQIPIKEFDEDVFFDNHSNSFRSKKRKSIIKELNKYFNEPIIITVTNSIDKRYKDVKVNLDLIETLSS